ncbi:MAG TPA: alanine dehydrogenase [Armatimonadota bacterium]|jgi:alanine dehydrogenase
MNIGVPCEVKNRENRVGCTPGGVDTLVRNGHAVYVERGAGVGSGFSDAEFAAAGAVMAPSAEGAWAQELVIKVKEPVAAEYRFLRPDLVLFTFLHLAADPALTHALLQSHTTGMAYETVRVGEHLPLLEPMSEIAGRMSAIVGAYYLSSVHQGAGVLLSGVPGVLPGHVLVLGGGTAGYNASRMATGLGAETTIFEVDAEKMRHLDMATQGSVHTVFSNTHNLTEKLSTADLLIGAVLVRGAKAPRLISRDMLRVMKPGAVFVDIAIDQGGCADTSRMTTHDNPVYLKEGVLHYCVGNMPGAYARTATQALSNVTIPYAVTIANLGITRALREHADLREGLNTWHGQVTYPAVAAAHALPCSPYLPEEG